MDGVSLIYEDKDFIAVSKPAGLLVHKVREDNEPTLVDWVLGRYPEVAKVGDPPTSSGQVDLLRPGIVHRLDKDTSGIILIPRNQEYFEYLKKLFQEHKIRKNYLALVYGKLEPKTGIIDKPIALKSGTTKRTVWEGKMEKEAVTEYEVQKYFKSDSALSKSNKEPFFTLVKVMPKTGRTHQIRIHLASVGHPIVGDSLYGPKTNPFNLNRQFLHAESLEWTTLDGHRMKIECELPDDLQKIISNI